MTGSIERWAVGGLLAAALLVLVIAGLGPLTGTYRLATVLSGSMGRGMPAGSVAVLVPMEPADVRVGDVLTFQAPTPDRQTVTHRVVEILEPGPHPVLRTMGDANPSPDPWTARIENAPAWRRIAVVPYAGLAIRGLRSRPVHHATVHVAPFLLLVAMLRAIWGDGFPRPWRRLPVSTQRKLVALSAAVLMFVGQPPALASFTQTVTAAHQMATGTVPAPSNVDVSVAFVSCVATITWTAATPNGVPITGYEWQRRRVSDGAVLSGPNFDAASPATEDIGVLGLLSEYYWDVRTKGPGNWRSAWVTKHKTGITCLL